MQIKRKALYNLLRMNYQRDPSIEVEPWQIEDYRILSDSQLFARLINFNIILDRQSFLSFAEPCESPEELVEILYEDDNVQLQDQIFLIIFELWRRYVHDKTCLSIFCDELDYVINRYDRNELNSSEPIEDALSQLEALLDENVDLGIEPNVVFDTLSCECANDIESFLYDFIAEQIDNDNYTYARDLLDGFNDYMRDVHWFQFLKARLAVINDPSEAYDIIKQIIKENSNELDLNLEILSFLAQQGQRHLFTELVKLTLPLLKNELDFQDLLQISVDYYHYLDMETEEKQVQKVLASRADKDPEAPLAKQDIDIERLMKLL